MLFRPSNIKIKASYVLISLTLGSGTILGFASHANMLSTCTSGLVFLAGSLVAVIISQKRLARVTI